MDKVTRQTFNEVMVPNYQPADLIPVRGAGSRFWFTLPAVVPGADGGGAPS